MFIEIERRGVQGEAEIIWNLYDVTGNIVLNGNQNLEIGTNILNVNTDQLSKGVYMLSTVMYDQIKSFRILKQ